jgi:hypothetical protein
MSNYAKAATDAIIVVIARETYYNMTLRDASHVVGIDIVVY